MSYHIEGNGRLKNLPERILVREDGYMAAYKFDGEPIVDYWYVPEAENAKLRELAKYAILCSEGDARCLDCPYHDKAAEPHIICMMRKAARELGVEVAL